MSFDAIKENYWMAKSLEKQELVSEHWDVFNKNFDKVIADKKIWKRMLRNASNHFNLLSLRRSLCDNT